MVKDLKLMLLVDMQVNCTQKIKMLRLNLVESTKEISLHLSSE